MKRKSYGADKDDDHKFSSIFSKLHQQPPPLHLPTSAAAVECIIPVSEREEEEQEEDSSSHIHNAAVRKNLLAGHLQTPTHDGATIEVVRRPRGRPPGSRNKPKPPSIVSKAPSEPSMSPYILELPAGVDVIAATTHFCRKRKLGLCILTGSGSVSNITIKQPSSTPGAAAVTFHGRFDILSISATILDQSGIGVPVDGQFTVYVAGGPQGQVVGGVVVGPMVSAATIYLVAGTFSGHTFCRLQHDVDEGDDTSRAGGGEDRHGYRPAVSGAASEHCPIGSLYSYS